ncbi:MAG: FtsX-like permease family protein, partial [Bacteroidota bacterium]|nr:FtsX-like permease family protein [Candidatus Kapabacteria bacterium]MDW8219046.1 FtsX-like permease family protein [Bacteroidota bacterium]
QEWTAFRTFLAEMLSTPAHDVYRESSEHLIQILVTQLSRHTQQRIHLQNADTAAVWQAFRQGGVIISESCAFHYGLKCGDIMHIRTEKGMHPFRIAGIYYEYASDIGIVVIERSTYEKFWSDRSVSGISIFLKSGVRTEDFIQRACVLSAGVQDLSIRSNRTLLQTSLEVFDRTFAITDVLRFLTIGIACVGVLAALMALHIEKIREIGVLRALGCTPRQVWFFTLVQTGCMGCISSILALPLGVTLAYILIAVINRRSFGWTLQYILSLEVCIQALGVAILAALFAGIYPAWRAARLAPSFALHEE